MESTPSAPRATRRDFLSALVGLSWLAPAAVLVIQAARFLGFQPPSVSKTRYQLGRPEALDVLPAYFDQGHVWLGRDSGGLYAVDAVCTHLGCVIEMREQGYECPCHGSRFTAAGEVLNGPATVPLRFLHLSLDEGGQVVVDRSRPVDPSFRLNL